MYPLLFNDVYKDYIWGGRNLEKFGKKLPKGIVAESWEISCHKDGPSVVINGEYKDVPLFELIKRYPKEIMGEKLYKRFGTVFPLLLKFIDAQNKLSVQVHPDDNYAKIHENENGKNEMWYVLSAKPNAALIYDLKKDVTKERFKDELERGRLEECLKYVNVSQGDVIYIPAGLIHAIGEGIVLIEIQQNSNSTYRVYDYNRKGSDGKLRPLHKDKALDVIDFKNTGRKAVYKGLTISYPEYDRKILAASEYLCAEEWDIKSIATLKTDFEKFFLVTCLDGCADVECNGLSAGISKGQSCLIPASCNNTLINGKSKCMVSYIPDIKKDVLKPLNEAGYIKKEIIKEIPGLNV